MFPLIYDPSEEETEFVENFDLKKYDKNHLCD